MPENQETQPQGDQPKSASPNPQQPARSESADPLSASIQDMWLTANEQLVEQPKQKEERQDSAQAILEGREKANRERANSPTLEERLAFYNEHWSKTESLDSESADGPALRGHAIDHRGHQDIRNNRANVSLEGRIIFASPQASDESLAGSTRASQESSTSQDRQTPPDSRAMRIARKRGEQAEKRRSVEVQRNQEGTSEEIDGPAR
jgi:hypothetical protein